MAALKIVFIAGDRQIVLYGQGMKQMWQVESHVLERLGEEERLKLETAKFRKYWIDEEGDRVEIINDVDYEFFLKRVGSHRTPKIYFEASYPENQQQEAQSSTSSPPQGRENLSVHKTVSCDMCNVVPIVGFRYKCMQCPNFDLCMKCEGEMKHSEHLMLRIPTYDSQFLANCPMTPLFCNKRRQRKYAAAAAAAAAGSGGETCGEGEGKSRHHRHHRYHAKGSGAGIFSNFYDMMHDLAEGGVPQNSVPTETPQNQQQQEPPVAPEKAATTEAASGAAAASSANSHSKETNTSPDRSSTSFAGAENTPRCSASAPPSFENLQNLIDPHFMKAGIQILNNFSEMFGKILDPVATGDASHPTSSPASVVIDLTAENRASTTPPPTATGTPNGATNSKAASAAGSGIVTPMETEVLPPSPMAPTPEALPRSRNSQSEENDWTMIDNNVATSTTTEAISGTTAAAAVAASSPPLDFAKLSQQLQSHIENENKNQAPTTTAPATPIAIPSSILSTPIPVPMSIPVVTSAPTPVVVPQPTTPDNVERRAVAVYHPDARINNAVHAMMAMGFSNEGAMLTQLLESVQGNIPLALDMMSAAQRN